MVNILDIGLGFDLAYCKHGIVTGLLDLNRGLSRLGLVIWIKVIDDYQ